MDLFAAELGMDPVEVRRRNFIPRDAFPYTTASGATYDFGDYEGALDLALARGRLRRAARRAAAPARAGRGAQLGIGVSVYVEVTNGIDETEFGEVEITPGRRAILRTGSFSHGQGHETTFAMIAAERLGHPGRAMTVVKGDTDDVAEGTGTYGSKSTQIGGTAARHRGRRGRRARASARRRLPRGERRPTSCSIGRRFHVVGAPEPALSWATSPRARATRGSWAS